MIATPLRDAQAGPHVAGAASHETASWQTINWSKAHRIVRRLQARIVQATQKPCPARGNREARAG